MRVTFEYGTTTKHVDIPDDQLAQVGAAFGYVPGGEVVGIPSAPTVEDFIIDTAIAYFNERVRSYVAQQAARTAAQQVAPFTVSVG